MIVEGLLNVKTSTINGKLRNDNSTLVIYENGSYDVTNYSKVVINVPNPSTGTLEVNENGTYNVKDYEFITIAIPLPKGNININENGQYDISQYATATVGVVTNNYNDLINRPSVNGNIIEGDQTAEYYNLQNKLKVDTGLVLENDLLGFDPNLVLDGGDSEE